jgi:hypothetical protein
MDDYTQIAPISSLPRGYLNLLKKSQTTKEPVVLFRRNQPVGGLVDYGLLQELLDYKKQMELKDALKMVSLAKGAFKKKQTKILKNPDDLWKPWTQNSN